ncbi:uncharacterized protein [Rutidosis leptorrhynchoides]|uniref:uncharacterized protein n=1 Tax=Rutidosis leptorrhynchoides TaxID=125765 RepID=UPI003A9A2DEC
MGCQVGYFPFIYLGMPIGAKMISVKDWSPVIDKFNNKLSGWKTRSMENIVLAGIEMENLQVHIKDYFVKTVGNGSNTLFWKEHWIGNEKLCNLFPRLYKLESNPDVSVQDRMAANNEELYTWNWKREISGRVLSELMNLEQLLSAASLVSNLPDKVLWSLDINGGFHINRLSKEIDDQLLSEFGSQQETIRCKLVPKKVKIFVWRAAKKKLPVRVELDNRGIDLNSIRCPLCDDSLESVDHALIFCKHARDVWERIFKWWNIGSFKFFSSSELLLEDSQASFCL